MRSPPEPPERRLPVLVVLHQEHSTPGRVGRLLIERGYALDVRKPRYGDPLPKTLADHAGAVIFGGPMSANDGDDFIRTEIEWIGVPLKERKPFLGLCLGAQMLTRHLGGRVEAHPEGRAEIGYYALHPTPAGERFAAETGAFWPSHVYQWHREGLDCPAGAELLAQGDDFPVQAIRVGPAAFGFQFHPEVTHAMVYRWTTRGAERLEMPGAQPPAMHHRGRFMHDAAVAAWLHAFLDHWLAAGSGKPPRSVRPLCTP
ncbi:glutamine amidotransferase [Chelatococcus sp. SYSU_G07232]|uniref:Glutamine amidotransferase n=1 Tax=Chelatococcus albus TaxID=3047466 RepID=A0ABT7AE18_9HYPH|nr:glutamine amidotransferase [Chelatococcus sp. SYSU_G07232]MDJ1157330.1 glutamine amidotransferase [Chelatococcus sp. SYSU_G07232]